MNAVYRLSIVGVLVLAGCATAPSASRREAYVRPGLIMLTADQAERRGIYVRDRDTSAASSHAAADAGDPLPSARKKNANAHLGRRTAEIGDSDSVHEARMGQGRETAPPFRAEPKSERSSSAETESGDSGSPMLGKEVVPYLIEQRKAIQANERAITALFEAVESLNRQQRALAERNPAPSPKAQTKRSVSAADEHVVETSESDPEDR